MYFDPGKLLSHLLASMLLVSIVKKERRFLKQKVMYANPHKIEP